jgi:hypothetical protein
MKKTWFITGASGCFGRIWAEATLNPRGDAGPRTAHPPPHAHCGQAAQDSFHRCWPIGIYIMTGVRLLKERQRESGVL